MTKTKFSADTVKKNASNTVTSDLSSDEALKNNIIILQEFKDLIQPLQKDEYEGLVKNILANGCKDSLVVWETTEKIINEDSASNNAVFVLVDGHNRYEICNANKIDFNVVLMYFKDMSEARDYMYDLQLGRRNATAEQIAYYRGKRYNLEVKLTNKAENAKGISTGNTAKVIAEQYNVASKTVERDGKYAAGLEKLDDKFKADILTGKSKISKKAVEQIGKIDVPEKIKDIESFEEIIIEDNKKIRAKETEKANTKKVKIDEQTPKIDETNQTTSKGDEAVLETNETKLEEEKVIENIVSPGSSVNEKMNYDSNARIDKMTEQIELEEQLLFMRIKGNLAEFELKKNRHIYKELTDNVALLANFQRPESPHDDMREEKI